MARRSEHSLEEIKEMILNAAESIVNEEGAAALTMRGIAMNIGYTVGSIYMVFDNMSDLILHLNARTLDEIASEIDRELEDEFEEGIEALALLYLRYASRNFNRWSLIFEHRLPKQARVPDWYQQKIERVFSGFEAQFAKQAPGCSGSDAENKQAARALWGGIHGISMLSLSGKLDVIGVDDAEGSLMLLVRTFLAGWRQSARKGA